jgi:hypothetical protein
MRAAARAELLPAIVPVGVVVPLIADPIAGIPAGIVAPAPDVIAGTWVVPATVLSVPMGLRG